MLDGIEIRLNTDFLNNKDEYLNMADKIIYTGALDEYYNYKLGKLEYRSLRFDTKIFDKVNYQGKQLSIIQEMKLNQQWYYPMDYI